MLTIITLVAQLITSNARTASACETYAPRIDGTIVTVCNGSVRSVRMASPEEFSAWQSTQHEINATVTEVK
jgi:hypothetical protein